MSNKSVPILFWNVHGLDRADKCVEVKHILDPNCPKIVFLQESKLEQINHFKSLSFLPTSILFFAYLPSTGASEGAITAWCADEYTLTNQHLGTFSLTT